MAQGVRGNNPAGLKLLVNLILAFLPAAVVGLCCASLIKEYLFNTYTVAYSWIVGGRRYSGVLRLAHQGGAFQ